MKSSLIMKYLRRYFPIVILLYLATAESAVTACFITYAIGSVTKVGLRNNCSECQMAVINNVNYVDYSQFTPGTLQNTISKVRVEAYSSKDIDIGNRSSEVIGQEPCR
jgi:hypothetical protein